MGPECAGKAIDAGCGPGHWAAFLAELGLTIEGVDQVPEFIEHARRRTIGVRFRVGTLTELDVPSCNIGGVLSWYSLIHFHPNAIGEPLAAFARVLKRGGTLLVGFFEGAEVAEFDHAVISANQWPVGSLSDELRKAGFDIVGTQSQSGTGRRRHAAIIARRTEHADESPEQGRQPSLR